MLKTRDAIMEHALECYNFGEDISISGVGKWTKEEADHYTCVLSADVSMEQDRESYSDDQDRDSYDCDEENEMISFHVRFENGTNKLEDVYALLGSTGDDIGEPGHKKTYDAVEKE
jgi:hypothetical protein